MNVSLENDGCPEACGKSHVSLLSWAALRREGCHNIISDEVCL